MKTPYFLFLAFIAILAACSDEGSHEASHEGDEEEESYGYSDGTYCAELEYYYSETGTRSTYTLEVEIESNELVKIYWPNGGWLDDSHFDTPDISDGTASFRSYERVDYEVSITGNAGNCWVSDNVITEDDLVEEYEVEERRDHTCTKCGGYSYSLYNGLCDNCKEDVTCPECGGEKYRHDDLCDNCERKHEDEKREQEEREEEEGRRAEDD